ncbi:hypothetical protein L6452_25428 [Arctium lappa]|uniref:Uncharacterized protein n=1 Tax=Arctium lappa TaxID=4217 RepID=A0ACB9AC21_ARCLA|nr:hypothetical protein L6452_25428 [Arctium lappa]
MRRHQGAKPKNYSIMEVDHRPRQLKSDDEVVELSAITYNDLDEPTCETVEKGATPIHMKPTTESGERDNMHNKEIKGIPTINLESDERRTTHLLRLTKPDDFSKKKADNKVNKPKRRNPNTNVIGIRTHTTPMVLHETIGQLKDKQKIVVKEMGLESLLTRLCTFNNLAEVDVNRKLLPLHAWNMDLLRQMHKTGLREGGLHMAEVRQDRTSPPQVVETAYEQQIVDLSIQKMVTSEPKLPEPQKDEDQRSEDPADEDDCAYDEEEVLINEARDMFPTNPCFDHYKESLDFLFREDNTQDDTMSNSDEEGNTDDAIEPDEKINQHVHQKMIVTPTKFNEDASLEDIQPLSHIWYSPITYNLIDYAIVEKSASKQRTLAVTTTYASNTASKQFVPEAMGAQQHGSKTSAPSFKLGFSTITGNPYERRDAKGKDKMAEEDCPPKANRREVKLGDLMSSPYVKRQVLLGKSITTEERKPSLKRLVLLQQIVIVVDKISEHVLWYRLKGGGEGLQAEDTSSCAIVSVAGKDENMD